MPPPMSRKRDPRTPQQKLYGDFSDHLDRCRTIALSRLYDLAPMPPVDNDTMLAALPKATVELARKAFNAYPELRFPDIRAVTVIVRHKGKYRHLKMIHHTRHLELVLSDGVRIPGDRPACLDELFEAIAIRDEMHIAIDKGLYLAKQLMVDYDTHPREAMFYIPGLTNFAQLHTMHDSTKALQKTLFAGPRVPKESRTLSPEARHAIEEFGTLASKAAFLEPAKGDGSHGYAMTFAYDPPDRIDPPPLFT